MKYIWHLNAIGWGAATLINTFSGHYYPALLSCFCMFYCYGIHCVRQDRDYWRGRWAAIAKEQPKP